MAQADITGSGARRGPSTRTRSFGTTRGRPTDWLRFGAVVMVVVGAFSVVEGVVALAVPGTFVTVQGSVLAVDLTAWAWLHLVLGVLVFLTGFALLRDPDSDWARVAGVSVVGLGVFVQLAWLPASPIWAVLMICLDMLVLAALLAGGDERAVSRR